MSAESALAAVPQTKVFDYDHESAATTVQPHNKACTLGFASADFMLTHILNARQTIHSCSLWRWLGWRQSTVIQSTTQSSALTVLAIHRRATDAEAAAANIA